MVHALSCNVLPCNTRFPSVIACLAIIVITWLVYLPFFKAYDNSLLKQEKLDAIETEKEMVTN